MRTLIRLLVAVTVLLALPVAGEGTAVAARDMTTLVPK